MGKGKRTKNNKANEQIANPGAYVENKGVSSLGLKIALSIIALIVVASLIFAFIQSTGLLLRADYGFKSENFEIDGAMMQYIYHNQIYNFLNTYYQYIYYYSMMGYKIVDFSKPLESQKFSTTAKSLFGEYDGTWFEFFWEQAEASAKQTLILCEAAKADGSYAKYEKEINDLVDEQMKAIKEASKQSFSSVNAYIEHLYGDGVNSSDVRKIEFLSQLSTKYYADKSKAFLEGLTDEQILKFHEENKSDYLKADYLVSSFTASLPKNPTEDQKKEFLADVDAAKKHAEAISKLESVEAIEEYLVGYWFDESFETVLKDTFKSDKIADDKKPTGEKLDALKTAMKAIVLEKALADEYNKDTDKKFFDVKDYPDIALTLDKMTVNLITTSRDSIEKVHVKKDAYGESTDREKWMFATDRKAGDFGTFYGTSETSKNEFNPDKDTSFTVNVFYMEKPSYLQETLTVQFGHILLTKEGEYKTDDKMKEKLIAIKDAFLKGELTKERFEELGKDVTEDSKVVYEDVRPDDMVKEMNDWLFDEARKAGDVEIVKTEDFGYHLTFYIGQGKEVWYVDSKTDLHVETVDNWYKDLEKSYEGGLKTKDVSGKITSAAALLSY